MAVTWLADVLRAAGVPVVEYPGWKTRAAPGSFTPRAVIWHHDASAAGPSPGLPRLIAEVGNSTTPPPLAQAWVAMDGVWTVTAAGRCNHAGLGAGWGSIPRDSGNTYAVGVETDHTTGEPWPAAQLASLRRGTAAILRHQAARPGNALCGHLEYAPGRKTDPAGLDMNAERRRVAGLMEETDMPLTNDDIEAIAARIFDAKLTPPGLPGGETRTVRQLFEDIYGFGLRTQHAEQLVEQLAARPVADVDEAALAEELAKRGIDGVSAAELREILGSIRITAGSSPS